MVNITTTTSSCLMLSHTHHAALSIRIVILKTQKKTTRVCHIWIDNHHTQDAYRVCLTWVGDHFGYRPKIQTGHRVSRTELLGHVASVAILFHWVKHSNGTKLMEYRMKAGTFEGAFERSVSHEAEVVHIRRMDVYPNQPAACRVTRHK
jgi:hypothetical protein